MIFFVLAIAFVALCNMSFAKENEFNTEYLSMKTTNSIKGIFVLLIIISHSIGYIEIGGPYDDPYIDMRNFLNQMVVVMFFFYSGYGMMESIKRKGMDYIKSIPFYRFFKVVFNFWLSLIPFVVLNLIIGKDYGIKENLLAFTGWGAIGNSNWYMFVIFFMYIFTFVSFFIFRKPKILSIAVLFALTIGFMIINADMGRPKYSYNTAMIFPLGFLYSYFKDYIEKIIFKNNVIYFFALAVTMGALLYGYRHRWERLRFFVIFAVAFTLLVVLITMKINISNSILEYFGKHIFSIYMLQRIPMIIFTEIGLNRHPYQFVVASFVSTLFISAAFDFVTDKIDALIFKKRPKKIEQ